MRAEDNLNIKITSLTKRDISNRVEELLEDASCSGLCPVDVESIIEKHLKLSILPIKGLKAFHSIDAYITSSFTIIVDETQYNEASVRYRFSLAHELAHYILHAQLYKQLGIDDINSHVDVQNRIPDTVLQEIEKQAYRFAGCLLLPDSAFTSVVNDLFNDEKLQGMTITEAYNSIEEIARDFNVSKDVVQRQLKYFYPQVYRGIEKIILM